MSQYIGLILFCGIGYAVWKGMLNVAAVYEKRVPNDIQDRIYRISKDFPQLVLDWVLSILFWTAIGAILPWLILEPLGFAAFLPSVKLALMFLTWLLISFLIHFWSTPHRLKDSPPMRGRELKKSLKSAPKSTVSPSVGRGRTIRSYRELR
jgi:hypothetical protein